MSYRKGKTMSTEINELRLQIMSANHEIQSLKKEMLEDKAVWLTDKYIGKLVTIDQKDFLRDSVVVSSPNFTVSEGEIVLSPVRGMEAISERAPLQVPSMKKFYGNLKIEIGSIREIDETDLETIIKLSQAHREVQEDKYKEGMNTLTRLLAEKRRPKATPWTEAPEDSEEDSEKAEESFKQAEPELVSDSTDKIEKLKMHQELVLKAGEKIKEIKDSLL